MSDCKLVHVSLWTPFRITTNNFRPIYPDENGFTFHVCNVADTKLESDLFPILSAHFYTCLHICISAWLVQLQQKLQTFVMQNKKINCLS